MIVELGAGRGGWAPAPLPSFVCYTARMPHVLRFAVLTVALFSAALGACADEDGLPAICKGDTPVGSLPIFAPCVYEGGAKPNDKCVEGSFCTYGFCAETCVTDDDCLEWDGFAGACSAGPTPSCFYPCVYEDNDFKQEDGACPKVNDLQLECDSLCQAPEPCRSQ